MLFILPMCSNAISNVYAEMLDERCQHRYEVAVK